MKEESVDDILKNAIQKAVDLASHEMAILKSTGEMAILKSTGNRAMFERKTKELEEHINDKYAQSRAIIEGKIKQLEGKIPEKFDPKEIKSELVSANKKIAKNLADIKKIITKTVLPIEEGIVKLNLKSGTLNEKFDNLKVPLKHKDLEDIWPDDHHPELHLLESHPGVQATSAELNRLVDGSDAGPLHTHAELRNIIISGGGMGEARVIDLINTYGGAGGINNIVEDLTPQLGGNLDGQAFTITTTNTISGGIVRTNNYQNLGGTESFIWSAGDDWWELSDDFHMVGVITGVASYNGLVVTANTGVITTGTWNGTDIAVADGGTGLGAIADGSVLVTNAANVLSAITWHAAGTKILTNIDGTISWEAAGAGAPTAWDDIGDPDADGTVAFAGFEQTLTSTLNEAAHTTLTIYNSTADLTAAVTLLKLTYKDDGDADGTFLNCLDNNSADSKFSIGQDGNTLIAGTLGVTGAITGNLTGNCSGTALTVTQAAQGAITSLGTLTTLTVDDITINGNTISSAGASTLAINPLAGQVITFDATVTLDAGVVAGITSLTADNIIANTGIKPDADGGAYLGQAGTAFADLYLKEGGTINWDSGDAIITQTGNDITISGITSFGLGTSTAVTLGTIELGAAADTTISRSGAGAIQVEGVQVLLSGAALGTPASGTVTNLTGTASININGTVGATTPTTIVGTTITANTGFCADVNDGSYLGVSGTAFSDLFLASGAVINFLAGAVTITHSANTLTIAGSAYTTLALGATNITCTGTIDNLTAAHVTTLSVDHIGEHTGSHTIVADNTITAATGASIILPAGGAIKLTLPTTDAQCTGHYTDSFQSGYTAAAGDLVYYGTGGKWLEVDADAVATCKGLLGIAMEAKNDTQAMKVALPGSMVHFDAWTWTTGDTLYAGETLGAIQNAIPTGADAVIKVVGVAIDADTIYFMGSPDQQTTVA